MGLYKMRLPGGSELTVSLGVGDSRLGGLLGSTVVGTSRIRPRIFESVRNYILGKQWDRALSEENRDKGAGGVPVVGSHRVCG